MPRRRLQPGKGSGDICGSAGAGSLMAQPEGWEGPWGHREEPSGSEMLPVLLLVLFPVLFPTAEIPPARQEKGPETLAKGSCRRSPLRTSQMGRHALWVLHTLPIWGSELRSINQTPLRGHLSTNPPISTPSPELSKLLSG